MRIKIANGPPIIIKYMYFSFFFCISIKKNLNGSVNLLLVFQNIDTEEGREDLCTLGKNLSFKSTCYAGRATYLYVRASNVKSFPCKILSNN